MSSRVTRSQTRNGVSSLKKEHHNENELAAREAELDAREAELDAREAELDAREKKCAHSLYLENLRQKKQSGQKLTELELLEEGSTPHCYLDLRKTHNFVCKKNCTRCKGTGNCYGKSGRCGYGNEEYNCYYGRWVRKTKEELEQEARMAEYYRSYV